VTWFDCLTSIGPKKFYPNSNYFEKELKKKWTSPPQKPFFGGGGRRRGGKLYGQKEEKVIFFTVIQMSPISKFQRLCVIPF
jgi:hypothetical protein